MPDDLAPASLALRLARWFDARLVECPPPPSSSIRLYALEVIDPAGIDDLGPAAVRVVFVQEGPDVATLFCLPVLLRAGDPDAFALVEHRWLPRPGVPARPGAYGQRRRARVLRVFAGSFASAIRFDDDPGAVVFSGVV